MTYAKKRVPVNFTIEPELKEKLKMYLNTLNDSKELKYVSQSDFINKAVENLLSSETSNG